MQTADKDWWLAHSADYVLGVLSNQDRKVFERIMHFEPAVQAMVRDWRATLQPMADALPPVDAPDHILPNLLSDLPEQIVKPVQLNYQNTDAQGHVKMDAGTALVGATAAVGGTVVVSNTAKESDVVADDLDFLEDSANDLPIANRTENHVELVEPLQIEGSTVMNLITKERKSADHWRAYSGWVTVVCICLTGWVYYLYS